MSGIDLYASLGLDRSADPATLAAELDRRISSSWGEDPAKVTQLRNARAILGDAGRRVRYDRQLDDPAAPPVTEQVLEQLASSLGNESETSVIPAADLGPQGYGQQQGFNTNPYASQPWQQGQPGKSGTSKVVWVVVAAVAAVIIVHGAVGTTWFIMRDDGDDNSSTSASRFTEQDAPHSEAVPVPTETEDYDDYLDDDDDYLDDYDFDYDLGNVSVSGPTATTATCDGRDCVRIEIKLDGDGEVSIMDAFAGDELQIDVFGVDVKYQDDFPVTDRSDGRFDYLRATSDEYDWPRLAIGVPEGTEYTVDDGSANHLITVEVFV
ncbi:MAG: hypothetical protein ACTH0X_01295 [Corynebacterium variabile]|uniref:hypothetical protein n=2 Tax=Corynebacterium variabile TaxID=1727 RepID=UPI003F90B6FC